MAETSQSAMRVIALVLFTMIFAGAWANDQPRESMAQKDPPKPTAIISQEEQPVDRSDESDEPGDELVSTEAIIKKVVLPELEEVSPVEVGMTLTISVETEGLSLKERNIAEHIQQLPLGIANGDYLMVDPQGGVGWLRIRGQQQKDQGERQLTTTVESAMVRYVRVTPTDALPAEPKSPMVPAPKQYASDEIKTVR